MRFMITGADGQLGCCLQDCLNETSHDYVALGKGDLDITDAGTVKTVVEDYKPDVIINAAAYTAVDKAETEPALAWQINSDAVGYLVAAANAVGALLVQVSTDYVFDGQASESYRESDPTNPLGVYGASKLAGEEKAAQSHRYLIVRTAWVFSEYGNNFVKTMMRLGTEREQLSIVADQWGTPTYAGDLAAILIRMAEIDLASGIYHFSGGRSCTWFEFAEAIFRIVQKVVPAYKTPKLSPIATSEYPTLAKRPAFSVLSPEKLEREMGVIVSEWEGALPRVVRASLQKDS